MVGIFGRVFSIFMDKRFLLGVIVCVEIKKVVFCFSIVGYLVGEKEEIRLEKMVLISIN